MSIHTESNYTLKGFEKLAEGSYSTVYRGVFHGEDSVLKIYKFTNRDLWEALLLENKRIRDHLHGHVRVPRLLGTGTVPHFYTIEEYLGQSLKDYLAPTLWDYHIIEDLKDCIDIITELPEDIPLDTRPENFVITKGGFISFVDFMPPDPWAFLEENTHLRPAFEEAFPHVIGAFNRREIRQQRYYLNKYRLVKFFHYLDIKQ